MKFWPVSVIAASPMLNNAHKWELSHVNVTKELSEMTMLACYQCADAMPVSPSPLAVAYDIEDTARFIYLGPPTMQDWLRLERRVFMVNNGVFGLMVDALH